MEATESSSEVAKPFLEMNSQGQDKQMAVTLVYKTVQERILTGAYRAGERLRESQLAEEIKVSRTPVREALQRLAAEDLVIISPNRGAAVAMLDAEDLEELFELRILLEGFATGIAAQRATEADITRLRAIQDRLRQAARSNDLARREEASQINLEFHREVLNIANNRRLESFVTSLTSVSLVEVTFKTYSDEQMARSVSQHDQIIEAIEHGDRNLAEMSMRVHINGARYSLKKELIHADRNRS